MTQDYLTLPLLNRPGFFHFFGKKGLSEADAKTLNKDGSFVRSCQIHGDDIIPISDVEATEKPTGDCLMTNRPGLLISIFTADCLPVILIDPEHRATAIVHAGWRGSLLRIVEKTVAAMTKKYDTDPQSLLVGMGHRIGPCCFEVGPDVLEPIEKEKSYQGVVTKKMGEKGWIDLYQINRVQLKAADVLSNHIAALDVCTACHPETFHSYRRDHVKGQNMVSGVLIQHEQ